MAAYTSTLMCETCDHLRTECICPKTLTKDERFATMQRLKSFYLSELYSEKDRGKDLQRYEMTLLAAENLLMEIADAARPALHWMRKWLSEDLCECTDGHICGHQARSVEIDVLQNAIDASMVPGPAKK